MKKNYKKNIEQAFKEKFSFLKNCLDSQMINFEDYKNKISFAKVAKECMLDNYEIYTDCFKHKTLVGYEYDKELFNCQFEIIEKLVNENIVKDLNDYNLNKYN